MDWISLIYGLFLLDALLANYMAWSGKQPWWQQHLGGFAKHFPLARGWTMYYLVLIVVMGIILHQTNLLVLPF